MKYDIIIPHNFVARDYQINFLSEVEKALIGKSEKRFFYQIWHRRAGKDRSNIADTVPRRLVQSPCLVKYVYPTLVMGRDNLWDGIGADGFRYINHLPEEIRAGQANQSRMTIPIKNIDYDSKQANHSLFQIAGSDRPDSLRGGNPAMIVFSEWAEQDPYSWDVVEPILRENNGIAIFNTTPKGDNHARALYEYAKNDPRWFVQILTAKDTNVFTRDELERIRIDIIKRFEADGRSQEEAQAYFDQEYMCSFTSPVVGSYYGANVRKAEDEKRITHVPYELGLPVHTVWDLGMDDSTTIWFFQIMGHEIRFIDYYENSGEGLAFYIAKLQEKKYIYGTHFAPHDIQVRELGTGKSRLEIAQKLGIRFQVAPALDVDEGINAVRMIFNQCWFDIDRCSRGIMALKNYRKDWDEKNKVFRNNPKHDWSSHGADAFRIFGMTYKKRVEREGVFDPGGVKPYIPGMIG